MGQSPPFHPSEKGQALLIVVLVMVVALTVTLSLASRSLTSLRNSNDEASSQKAFAAAEAGVERALKLSSPNGVVISNADLGNNSEITQVDVTQVSGSQLVLNNSNPVPQDDGVDVWLTNYPSFTGNTWTGTLYVFWGTKASCTDGAVEVIVLSGTTTSPTVQRFAADPCDVRRNSHNHFSTPSAGGAVLGTTYNNSIAITVGDGLMARVTPLYAGTSMAVTGYDNGASPKSFPSQGNIISSTGTSGTTQRKVQFYQGYPEIPSEYFYSLFSPN